MREKGCFGMTVSASFRGLVDANDFVGGVDGDKSAVVFQDLIFQECIVVHDAESIPRQCVQWTKSSVIISRRRIAYFACTDTRKEFGNAPSRLSYI